MSDNVLTIIANTDAGTINFEWFRSSFKADNDMMEMLKRGHAVLDTPEQMNQYLYTYGPMIESQWENATPWLTGREPPVLWIDYGCGQGLAGMLIRDNSEEDPFRNVSVIVLIEPSGPALARAEAIYRKLAPNAQIKAICKRFNAVLGDDIPNAPPGLVLHLFSNSMDIAGIDAVGLTSKALRQGRHIILAVSHDRDFNGGTPQIEAAKKSFEDPALGWLTIHTSELARFECRNQSRSKGVMWFCEMEIGDG